MGGQSDHGHRAHAVLTTIGVLTLALAAAGCGGSGGAPATTASGAVASGSGAPTDTPAPASGTVAYADCGSARFGPPLSPVNPPTEVHTYSGPPATTINVARLYRMTISTVKGDMVLCLQPQLAPRTVNVVVTLARNHFYDGVIMHRAEPNFVIQGGDPTGTGQGGPGFLFNDEPVRNSYLLGSVAMANSGTNTNGSQFFICIGGSAATATPATAAPSVPVAATASGAGTQCAQLPPKYNLFGRLESGLDVANSLRPGTVMTTVTVAEQV